MTHHKNPKLDPETHQHTKTIDLHHSSHHHPDYEEKKTRPISIILALGLILLIILMIIPIYSIKLDPEPKSIPSINSILPANIAILANQNLSIKKSSRADYKKTITPNNPVIKQIANIISTSSCPTPNKVCYAKALFYFVKNNIKYVSDPPNEYLATPFETLYTKGGDCDDSSILLASLTSSIGISTRLTFIPHHVYVQIKLDNARNKYKEKDGWISLDPTCQSCKFSETPFSTQNKKKNIIGIS